MSEIARSSQDLFAPDVKSEALDLSALRVGVDRQFKSLSESKNARFDAADAPEQARFTPLRAQIDAIRIEFVSPETLHAARHEAILNASGRDKRLD